MNDLAKITEKQEKNQEQALEFFDAVTSGDVSPKQLSEKTGLSLKTVYNRISQGRDIVDAQIKDSGSKYLADVFRKYEYIWEQAKIHWVDTGNVLFLKEMGSVLMAIRKMLSVDAAAKAPVNEKGQVVPESLIMVFNDASYKEKEQVMKEQMDAAVEGGFTVTDSTKGPLTGEEDTL